MGHDLAIAGAFSILAMMPKAVRIGRSAKDDLRPTPPLLA